MSESATLRTPDFIKGIELATSFSPTLSSNYPYEFANLYAMGANWVILTPSITFYNINPPRLSLNPGSDPFWQDVLNQISFAKQDSLKVAIFPKFKFTSSATDFWSTAVKDISWWNEWQKQYQELVNHFTLLANTSSADALILGGSDLEEAINSPIKDSISQIIANARQQYGGKIIWAIDYPDAGQAIPTWLPDVDMFYIQINSARLASSANVEELKGSFVGTLQNHAQSIKQQTNKPVIIGLLAPSTPLTANSCSSTIPDCDISSLDQPNPVLEAMQVDLHAQADEYSAILSAINQSAWVDGFVSMQYSLPVRLQDSSNSIHGKPAEDIVRFWFYNWHSQ